jgi:dTMP kinase
MLKFKKGLFITFEGPEGAGKTTQIKLFCELLQKRHIPYVTTREPGGSKLSTHLRKWILNRLEYKLAPETELFLFLADRAQHVKEVILPALQKGKIVVCDRYTDSTLAYQGGGRGFSISVLKQLNHTATDGLTPDLTVLFDIPVELGLRRAIRRGKGKDRMEKEALNFHRRVRQTFLRIARQEKSRVFVLDARKSREEVFNDIEIGITNRLRGNWSRKIIGK